MKLSTFLWCKILITLVFILTMNIVFGQPGSDDSDPGDPCPGYPNCVPIDGGLGFLVAAGVALVSKKLWNANKINE